MARSRHAPALSRFSRVSLTALAFFSLFSFFPNPAFPNNEIQPYYLLPAFALLATRHARLFLVVLITSLVGAAAAVAARGSFDLVATDSLQVISVAVVMSCAATLSDSERVFVAGRLRLILYVVIGFIVAQRVVPALIDFTYQALVRRDTTALDLQRYTGGVPGIAPEPAYMGSYIIGAWIVITRFTGADNPACTIACAVGLVLTASLSACLIFAVVLVIQFVTSMRRMCYCALIALAAIAVMLALDSSLIPRIGAFADSVRSGPLLSLGTLSTIDDSFGSTRLTSLVRPFSEAGCGIYFCGSGEFAKGYSLFAVLFGLVAPLHLLFGVVLAWRARDRLAISSALLAVCYGPVLNWQLLAGLLGENGTEHAFKLPRFTFLKPPNRS